MPRPQKKVARSAPSKAARARPKAPARTRRRRSPDEARAELLDAAERVFSERGPDAAGLRDVAREAGVSHGLITHYFKTYEGLIEAVFVRRTQRIASGVVGRLQAASTELSAMDLVRGMIQTVSEPVHLRLVAWAMLSGRAQRVDFMPGRERSLRPIADAVHEAAVREAERARKTAPSRDDVDYALMLALGATYGWGLGKAPFMAALGRKPTLSVDEEARARLELMLQALLSPR
jgi:AcrR family transcriptional regulator